MNCTQCEERMSDYLENVLSAVDRHQVGSHLQSCNACSELLAGMRELLTWAETFPVYESPAWLPARIVSNTPRIARESWSDTLRLAWQWLIEPRTAMAIFTAIVVIGWLGGSAGISPNWPAIVRNPMSIYYEGQVVVNRVYDSAVRAYYRSPLVEEIEAQIEQLREVS